MALFVVCKVQLMIVQLGVKELVLRSHEILSTKKLLGSKGQGGILASSHPLSKLLEVVNTTQSILEGE
jgi:hypothetical protein